MYVVPHTEAYNITLQMPYPHDDDDMMGPHKISSPRQPNYALYLFCLCALSDPIHRLQPVPLCKSYILPEFVGGSYKRHVKEVDYMFELNKIHHLITPCE